VRTLSLSSWIVAGLLGWTSVVHSESDIQESVTTQEESLWTKVRKNLKSKTYTEFMSPGFGSDGYTPKQVGGKNDIFPAHAWNISWLDYGIGKNTRILYWQRTYVFFAPTKSSPNDQVSFVLRNPRFCLRQLNVFDVPNLSTAYEVYVQPGWAQEGTTLGRNLEFGVRTQHAYAIPGSRWTLGALSETQYSIYFKGGNPKPGSANLYGWIQPSATYGLSKMFSTQHYVTVYFKHARETSGLQLGEPLHPYIQNGIGANFDNSVWVSAFINNYVTTLPTISNTWASLWVTLNLL
jgi:hypothetical protein